MGKKTASATPMDDTIEFAQPDEPLITESSPNPSRRGKKAVFAAGAVASAVAATGAYRRRRARMAH